VIGRFARRVALAALLAVLFPVPGWASERFIDYLYIDANEGGSSGGHVGLLVDDDVFHFEYRRPGMLVLRRETFDEVGLFATDMTLGEDLDWALRVRDAGMKTVILEAALVRYRIHDENTTVINPENAAMYLRVLRSSLARRRAGAGGSAHAG